MNARIDAVASLLPDVPKAIQTLYKSAHSAGVSAEVLGLVHLRVSQINGCSACVDSGARGLSKAGTSDQRLFIVAAWRETEWFSEPERAALALAEAATRMADRPDPVPDDIWQEAAKHFSETELAALVLWIATSNFFNRLNVTTRQPAGQDWG
ncbi:MAG TPA: carboxymuconolactone decarboxylase family protein [Sporichthyaceae bacterium]|jgi:AhpD family alkylhydroperoxidase|nr:carboxymuconolactone decarboxylase family protein [Sporichthyaceae bacterium]